MPEEQPKRESEFRGKYYDALQQIEQLEHQQAEWAQTEELLRQCILRLAVIADDSQPAIAEKLKLLRTELRTGTDVNRLRTLVDDLSAAILHHDDAPTPLQYLGDLLDRITFPAAFRAQVRRLRARLNRTDGDVAGLVDELARLLDTALSSSADPGLVGRILGNRERGAGGGLGLARELLAQVVEALAARMSIFEADFAEQLRAAREQAELERLTRRIADLVKLPEGATLPVHEVLLRLVERLEVPLELSARVEEVKARLTEGFDPSALDPTLAAIADLVGEMRNRAQGEKRELEDFLKQLTVGLQEIDQSLRANLDRERGSRQAGQHLDTAVRERVQAIEVSVSQAQDLGHLQQAVRQHLERVREQMDRFRDTEAARLEAAEAEVDALTRRLHGMASEIESLRERVVTERYQALVDPLTGIPNRLAYAERIAQEVARWQRLGTPLSLSVWDVDEFKRINDRYGHLAGDKVLRVVAKLLKTRIRATDMVARYGGEEFVMVLPDTDRAGALQLAEQLRKVVAECEFHHQGEPVSITISAGVAQFGPGDTPDTVFQRADKALYHAKRDGRNLCRAEEESSR